MITGNMNNYLREKETDFTCNVCGGKILYVQVIESGNNIVADFFECDRCDLRIETMQMQEEEFPAFYD